MIKQTYEYHGNFYTITDLARISNLHRDTIIHRLEQGWSVETAIETPARERKQTVKNEDIGKTVPIVFKSHLPVYESMQPVLGKQYFATVCGTLKESQVCRVFYVVELENGKKLITYPGEFEEIKREAVAGE